MNDPAAPAVGPADVLAFACEIAALALLAVSGWSLAGGGWDGFTLALGLPVAGAVFWGWLLAPRSRRRLQMPARLVVKAGFYLVVGFLGALAGYHLWALVLVLVAVANAAWRDD